MVYNVFIMEKFYLDIGKRIEERRTELDLTMEGLAIKAGINLRYLYAIKSGKKHMSAWVMHKICMALGVSYDWLLTGEE